MLWRFIVGNLILIFFYILLDLQIRPPVRVKIAAVNRIIPATIAIVLMTAENMEIVATISFQSVPQTVGYALVPVAFVIS